MNFTETTKTKDYEIYKSIFYTSLGDEISKHVESFFHYLFTDMNSTPPLKERCYIVFARSGFALLMAADKCGLCDDLDKWAGRLISDRCWKKMTIEERQNFTRDRHVFLIDDSIIDGFNCEKVYNDLDMRICRSRNVAVLSADGGFSQSHYFEKLYYWRCLSPNKRHIQNSNTMVALYNLAVPFTAEVPSYSLPFEKTTVLENWTKCNGTAEYNFWKHVESNLDFGSAGLVRTTFLLQDASFDGFSPNFWFRGVRVCYRLLSKEEDASESHAEVSLVPYVLFDVLNYCEVIDLLLKYTEESSWIHNQLIYGETHRKRIVVQRVISFLLSFYVAKKFFIDMSIDTAYLPIELKHTNMKYHFYDELLEGMDSLLSLVNNNTINGESLFQKLSIENDRYTDLLNSTCGSVIEGMKIPDEPQTVDKLGDLLCEERERGINEETDLLQKARHRSKHPMLCYSLNKQWKQVLAYLRCSVGSLHSTLLNHKEHSYLVNVIEAGEGAILTMVRDYEFIWALHCIFTGRKYKSSIVTDFASYWNEQNDNNHIDEGFVKLCKHLGNRYWPSKTEIRGNYEDDKPLRNATEVADNYIRLKQRTL